MSRSRYNTFCGCLFLCFVFLVWVFFSEPFHNPLVFPTLREFFPVFRVDGLGILFASLVFFLFPACFLASWENIKSSKNPKAFFTFFMFLELVCVLVFFTPNLYVFYVLFELVLLPMFIIIGCWGSRERRIRAAYMFFLYTFAGSLVLLVCLVWLHQQTGNIVLSILCARGFGLRQETWLFLGFFVAFATKVPMLPLHLWLPEAHVEAPTAGSVILAGVLLKLGTYGFLRFLLPLFSSACFLFQPPVLLLASLGVFFSSSSVFFQSDIKRMIAYTSVAHMNLVVAGIFALTHEGKNAAVFQSVSHGFVSSALFLCVGVLYDRLHVKNVAAFGGLALSMPVFAGVFFLFTCANMGLPGTSNFAGEFLLLTGIFPANDLACFVTALSLIFGAAYSLWFFNRLFFGMPKMTNTVLNDLCCREVVVFAPLACATLLLGLRPGLVLFLLV